MILYQRILNVLHNNNFWSVTKLKINKWSTKIRPVYYYFHITVKGTVEREQKRQKNMARENKWTRREYIERKW